jgi:hypothetical protein
MTVTVMMTSLSSVEDQRELRLVSIITWSYHNCCSVISYLLWKYICTRIRSISNRWSNDRYLQSLSWKFLRSVITKWDRVHLLLGILYRCQWWDTLDDTLIAVSLTCHLIREWPHQRTFAASVSFALNSLPCNDLQSYHVVTLKGYSLLSVTCQSNILQFIHSPSMTFPNGRGGVDTHTVGDPSSSSSDSSSRRCCVVFAN